MEKAAEEEHKKMMEEQNEKASKETSRSRKSRKEEPSFIEKASKNTMVRQIGRTIFREITRGILGALGVKK